MKKKFNLLFLSLKFTSDDDIYDDENAKKKKSFF